MTFSPEIKKIREKNITSGWPRFISNVTIDGLHGFNHTTIEFKFPICAVVGENGTGKTTLLKVIACAYRSDDKERTFFPSDFFPDTIWDKLKKTEINFQYRQGPKVIDRSIKKPTQRWRGLPNRPVNNIFLFDIDRTMPIDTVIGYSKLAKKTIKETTSRRLKKESTEKISEIMCRQYTEARFAITSIDKIKEVGILKFPFGEISRFHQGAGEAMVSDMIAAVENIPDYSLVIIDEIESSLHPTAQRRLLRQLLNLTRIKTLQVIISTHSPYVLSELPPEARILLARGNESVEIIYAPSVEFCLSRIDDELHTELDVLVEDEESKFVVSEIIRVYAPEVNDRIRIIPAGSADVVWTLARLSSSKKIPYKIVGIVDADQTNMDPAIPLPGDCAPEKQIITDVLESHHTKLAQVLSLPESHVKKELSEVILLSDYHQWLDKLANKFNIPKAYLWTCLATIWVNNCLTADKTKTIIDIIKEKIKSHR